ncbi:MAG TPA: hypothetical protein V6D22_18180 [Candidatus Obscuribacterales bacterium]
MTEQYICTIRAILEADHEMFIQLKFVAHKLEQFYASHKHFPRTDEERASFKQSLAKFIIANPYHPIVKDLIQNKMDTAPYQVPVFWMEDKSLDQQAFEQFLKKPDPSWQGEPGTIFILTNGDNIYLLFAATADRLPMRDFAAPNQPPRMICKQINLQM